VRFYENWANMVTNHEVPYRDFRIEYPPLALVPLVVPIYARKLFGYTGTYFEWFRIEIAILGLLVQVTAAYALAALHTTRRRAYVAMCVIGIMPAVLGPIALSRYDYWPTLFAAAAVAALAWRRPTLACGLAAAGAAAKVFPIVLLPLALIELWRRGRGRAVVRGLAWTLGVLAVIVVPFAAVGPHGLSWALQRQLDRPLQVESLGAAVFGIAHVIAGVDLHVVKRAGSDNLIGTGPDVASTLLGIATIVALVLVYWLYARSRRTAEQLVTACAAAVTAYIAFSKVFSPQYLIWLFPLVPIVRNRAATVLFVVIVGMTQIWEPYQYFEYYTHFSPGLTTLVLVRDLLVVALAVLLIRSIRDAEQLDPGRSAVVGAVDDHALDSHVALSGREAHGHARAHPPDR
jgi:hypothetical protein